MSALQNQQNLTATAHLKVRDLGRCDYQTTLQQMQDWNAAYAGSQADELWFVEHPPVFTLGLNGKQTHILQQTAIPIVQTDRGGQVTYHGPGQIVAYTLIDIKRRGLGIKQFVNLLEETALSVLADYNITAQRKPGAPGIYIEGAKIAALGLRVRHHCTYHGIALNVDMDLTPFNTINPCGYAGLATTMLKSHLADPESLDIERVKQQILSHFCRLLHYNTD